MDFNCDQQQKLKYILENTILLASSIASFVQTVQPLIQELQNVNLERQEAKKETSPGPIKSQISVETPTILEAVKNKSNHRIESDFVLKKLARPVSSKDIQSASKSGINGISIKEPDKQVDVEQSIETPTSDEQQVENAKEKDLITSQTADANQDENAEARNLAVSEAVDANQDENAEATDLAALQEADANQLENVQTTSKTDDLAFVSLLEDTSTKVEEAETALGGTVEKSLPSRTEVVEKEANLEIATHTIQKNAIAMKIVDFQVKTTSPTTIKMISRVKFNLRPKTEP